MATNTSSLPAPPNQLSIKLDSNNYILWKLQIEPFLAGYDLIGHVNGTTAAPTRLTAEGAPNPRFQSWYRHDQLVLGWIINSLPPSVVHTLVGITTAHAAWTALATTFDSGSPSQIRSLKAQLLDLRLNDDTAAIYLQHAKAISDRLQALGQPVQESDFIQYVLRGLPPTYRPFIRSVNNRADVVTYLELHGLLISEELDLKMEEAAQTLQPQTNFVHTNNRGRSGRGRGRGQSSFAAGTSRSGSSQTQTTRPASSQQPPASLTSPRPMTCFNCYGIGHHYKMCPSPRQDQPFPQAHYATSPAHSNLDWTLDSGATHHLTNDLDNLALHSEYQGTEQLQLN